MDDGRVEARIIRKLGQSAHQILGVFESGEREGRVTPVDRKAKGPLIIGLDDSLDAVTGELVLVEILAERGFGPKRARVRQRLVDVTSPKAVSLIAIHAHGIPVDMPADALEEAEQAKPARLEGGRVDLCHLPLITIDPEDARDHDDAVFAELDSDPANPGGFVIWVAIADVAYYVRPGSSLDAEALRRGNSVYLPDRVVPMLPERLSTDLCSLKEGERRPCMAVRMVFGADGVKRSHAFSRAMMRCAAGLHYAQVQRAIDGQPDDKSAPMLDSVIRPLYAAYAALSAARDKRGPLDLDLPERKVELGDDGRVAAIRMRERLDAHRLIEELMIQANVAAAETLEQARVACLYRVHEAPTVEKLEALKTFLKTLDLKIAQGQVIRPQAFNTLLAQVRESPHREMINELVLRSQTQAYYGPERLGHFGLALTSYAHFTSPIRRYADLLVHRGLIRALSLGKDGMTGDEMESLDRIGEMISQHERRAMAAERESIDRYLAAFMADKVGASFTARISGVTRFGLFVALVDSGADGLIPISSLGTDFFRHDPARHALIGERSREVYRLGERVTVKLEEATPVTGGLRFSLLRDGSGQGPSKGQRPTKPSRAKRAAKRQSAA
jgi:ribonuclease R